MPIHMGIMCEACRKVHFVAASRGIGLSRTFEGMYRLKCTPPCPEVKDFRKEAMYAYRISDDVFQRGYAEEGEYELIQKS
jgi:hypothetical protein